MHKPAEAAFHDPAAREHDKACLSWVTFDHTMAHAVPVRPLVTYRARCASVHICPSVKPQGSLWDQIGISQTGPLKQALKVFGLRRTLFRVDAALVRLGANCRGPPRMRWAAAVPVLFATMVPQ